MKVASCIDGVKEPPLRGCRCIFSVIATKVRLLRSQAVWTAWAEPYKKRWGGILINQVQTDNFNFRRGGTGSIRPSRRDKTFVGNDNNATRSPAGAIQRHLDYYEW